MSIWKRDANEVMNGWGEAYFDWVRRHRWASPALSLLTVLTTVLAIVFIGTAWFIGAGIAVGIIMVMGVFSSLRKSRR